MAALFVEFAPPVNTCLVRSPHKLAWHGAVSIGTVLLDDGARGRTFGVTGSVRWTVGRCIRLTVAESSTIGEPPFSQELYQQYSL